MTTAAIMTAAAVLLTSTIAGAIAILAEIRRVHTIVNQQRTDMVNEIRKLRRMIRRMGGNPNKA